ncbi:endospore germination permease [Lysinibacillus sphaericus]|uniref:endospore germination permease n=3 Tax=Lysinibacillus sphaericus TaxID=1421 RepID=UPI001EF17C5B|nr:endospore germination permease [Lysinibacillus sphaericus]
MEKEVISSRQFTIITSLLSIGTAILIIPSTIASSSKQDAWIAASIGVVLSLLVVKLFLTLGNQTPTLNFIEANEKIFGRFFGKITVIGFLSLTLFSGGELLYFIGIFMKTEVMPETPTLAFALLFSIIIMYAAYLGLETFARSAEILFPMFILIFIFFIVCITPQIKFENIQPIMEVSKTSMFYSIIRFMSVFSFSLVMLLMIYPASVNVQQSSKKGFYIGTILGGFVLVTLITLCILVLGAANTASRTFPSYALAQRISIGNFLQRIEIIMAFMWITSIFIRTFMYFYTTVVGIAQIMKLKDHRPLILPMGIIMIGLSQIIHPDIVHSDNYNNEIWPIYSFIFTILLPILLLIVAVIRNRKSQGNAAEMANQEQVTDVGGNTDVNQGNQPNPANTDSQQDNQMKPNNRDVNQDNQTHHATTDSNQDNQMKPNNRDANQDNPTNDAASDSNQDNQMKPNNSDANQDNQTHHATTDSNQDNQMKPNNRDANQDNPTNDAASDSNQDNQMKPNNSDANQDNQTHHAATDSNQDNQMKPNNSDANQDNQTHHAATDSNQDNQMKPNNRDANQNNPTNNATTDSNQDNQMKPNNRDANQDNPTNDAATDSNQDNQMKPNNRDANQDNQTHHATDSNQDNHSKPDKMDVNQDNPTNDAATDSNQNDQAKPDITVSDKKNLE